MAYAAVISAKRTIERLIIPVNPQISISAHEELKILHDVLARLNRSANSSINRRVINELDADIRNAVWILEDVLQSYALHHSLSPSDEDESGVKQEIDSFLVTVKKLGEEYISELDNPSRAAGEEYDTVLPVNNFGEIKSTMVRLLDQRNAIRDELQDLQSNRKILAIVGMAGIGKTFLARNIYQSLINGRHFNLRAWVSVGPNCKIEKVLVDILTQIMPETSYNGEDKSELTQRLHTSLYSRSYFIVLDDIWSTEDWGYLVNFFPENGRKSRILLTTRLETIQHPTSASYSVHSMELLSNQESWNLLRQIVFDEESVLPSELEKAGRKIAEKCEGLPLLILAVADILGEPSLEHWKEVADGSTNTFANAYEIISEVLSSSYEYLPQYLKACFLYMAAFPQNSEIPITKLINLCTVEDFLETKQPDFLETKQPQTLEDFAINCFSDLVSKNLVIVCKHSSGGKIKSCKLHSGYWSLCVREARKHRFLHVLNIFTDGDNESDRSHRRISVQNSILLVIEEVYDSVREASTTRSLMFTGQDHQYPVPVCFDLVLLKVLDALAIRFYEFPSDVLKLLHLKYLALTHYGDLPSFISNLQNLQSLILHQYYNIKLLRDSSLLPKEIWDMKELRHLRIMANNLPNPSNGAELPNLLTLHVKGHSCTEEVFRSIPKLKKLGIKIELRPRSAEIINCFEHISILEELKSLKCVVVNPRPRSQAIAPPNPSSGFPQGLKKLSLKGLGYSWEHIRAIGLLPHLDVLKLRCFAFRGPEWNTEFNQFQSLKFLLLEDIDLVSWTSDDEYCFPQLQRLIIRHCYKIEEMPEQIEDIPTLQMIEIVECHPFVMEFGLRILDQKKSFGNDCFQVPITSSSDL